MAKNPTTRDLSDKHEEYLHKVFGGRRCPGSGNQSRNPLDVRMDPQDRYTPIAFGFDGKSTQRGSLSISLAMWNTLCEQAHGLRPAMPLRFYGQDNLLPVRRDLVVLDLNDFAEVLGLANIYQEMSGR